MNEFARFEQWLGQYFPRACVAVSPPGPVQRMTVSLIDQPTSGAFATMVAERAWDYGLWVVERNDWGLSVDGRLEVRCIEFVRGAP